MCSKVGVKSLKPSVSELTSDPDSLSFSLGSLIKRNDNKLEEVKAILGKMKMLLWKII